MQSQCWNGGHASACARSNRGGRGRFAHPTAVPPPSLRAKRSNPPYRVRDGRMDCFVALLLAMTAGCTLLSRDLPRRRRRAREIGGQLRMARLWLLRGFFLHRALAADAIRQLENFEGGIERQRRKHFEHVGDVLLISNDP